MLSGLGERPLLEHFLSTDFLKMTTHSCAGCIHSLPPVVAAPCLSSSLDYAVGIPLSFTLPRVFWLFVNR